MFADVRWAGFHPPVHDTYRNVNDASRNIIDDLRVTLQIVVTFTIVMKLVMFIIQSTDCW
jgi:hypothetical protein